MKTIIKFNSPGFGKFNNYEYTNFMDRFCTLTIQTGAEVLHYEQADMDRLLMLKSLMQDLVAHTTSAEETEDMKELDKKRDSLGRYIIDTVRAGQDVPLETKAEAAKTLYRVLKPYEGFYSLPNMQETTAIKGLLVDISTEKYVECITALGLADYVDELERVNTEYAALTDQRSIAKETNMKADSATLRNEMDALYEYITTVVFAYNVITPAEELAQYIRRVNVFINDANTAYNQRTGNTKKTGDKVPAPPSSSGTDTSPGTQPTDPETGGGSSSTDTDTNPDNEPTNPDTGNDDNPYEDEDGGLAG